MILLLLFKLILTVLNHWRILLMKLIIFSLAPVLPNSMSVVVPSDTLTIMVTVSPVTKKLLVIGSTNSMKDIKSMYTTTPRITLHMKQTLPIIILKRQIKLQVRKPIEHDSQNIIVGCNLQGKFDFSSIWALVRHPYPIRSNFRLEKIH